VHRHVTVRNVRFLDFSQNLAVDIVDTKRGIGQIVSTLRIIRTVLSNGLFTTFVCCSQHVELLTNSVSARHWSKCPIFKLFVYLLDDVVEKKMAINQIVLALKIIRTVF